MHRIGIITGLAMEADILRQPAKDWGIATPIIKASGPGITHAYKSAQYLLGEGAKALMSFGLCGGLSSQLKAGDIVLAENITQLSGENYACDPAWLESLRALLAGTVALKSGAILSERAIAATLAGKQELQQRSSADAIDMESAGIARAAQESGVPFIALRAVSDPASAALPPLALTAIDEAGVLQPGAVLKSLLRHPTQITALPELARNSKQAIRALGVSARLAGPGFGFC